MEFFGGASSGAKMPKAFSFCITVFAAKALGALCITVFVAKALGAL